MIYTNNEIEYLANSLDFHNIAEVIHLYEDERQFYRFSQKLFSMDRRAFYFFIKTNKGVFNEVQMNILKRFYPNRL